MVVAMLFFGDTLSLTLDKTIAAFFVLAVLALIGSFCCLLREIFIASKSMRTRRHMRAVR
jgi:hypothetical protein